MNSSNHIVAYADDITLLYKNSSWKNTKKIISENIYTISNWFTINGLTINFDKTKLLYFGCYANRLPTYKLFTFINGHDKTKIKIEVAKEINYLGVTLDSNLKWRQHICNTINKTRHMIHAFIKLRDI